MLREMALVVGISLVGATLSAFFHPRRPAWFEVISDEELRWTIDEDRAAELVAAGGRILWVDARPSGRFEEYHFPGAISLDVDNWAELLIAQQEELEAAMGIPVIVYCDGNRCEKSMEVATRLRELAGLDPVYLLRGDWRKLVPGE